MDLSDVKIEIPEVTTPPTEIIAATRATEWTDEEKETYNRTVPASQKFLPGQRVAIPM